MCKLNTLVLKINTSKHKFEYHKNHKDFQKILSTLARVDFSFSTSKHLLFTNFAVSNKKHLFFREFPILTPKMVR